MLRIEPKLRNQIVLISFFIFVIAINTKCAKIFAYSSLTEWWINTSILFAIVMLIVFTVRDRIKMIYKLLIIPASWVTHAVLTFPAALLLGILKYDPEHVRTAAEHRAVFVLASIPILFFGMKKSRLF